MKQARHFISLGADIKIDSSISIATRNGHLETLKLLHDHDAKNFKNHSAEIACLAAAYNYPEILEFLHEKGYRLDKKGKGYFSDFTPAHCAAERRSIDAIRTLGGLKNHTQKK